MIAGHARQRRLLRESPPQVALLRGPAGIGKFEVAVEASHARTEPVDVHPVRELKVGAAREIITTVSRRPLAGPECIAVLDLDGATPQAANALLKTLEEPLPTTRLWLTGSGSIMPTVQSRCSLVPFLPLSAQELASALREAGVVPEEAETLSGLSGGSVEEALRLRPVLAARSKVQSLLKAVAARNWTVLGSVLRGTSEDSGGWTRHDVTALRFCLSDILSDTERFFERDELYGLDRAVPRSALLRADEFLRFPTSPSLAVALATEALLA